ncbi:unnamed protein product [Medioppia subpectinata]|uniref:Uncharacterized protein n=1 Tax=Medioppia subpectinata TaxID=1979941 RepID=A0A7R9KXM1_9ACAR|nr:unnamed protein product [Medioppia subpectinata]CAG2111731.1 unnamed protein product [Medioppia subpectinata]
MNDGNNTGTVGTLIPTPNTTATAITTGSVASAGDHQRCEDTTNLCQFEHRQPVESLVTIVSRTQIPPLQQQQQQPPQQLQQPSTGGHPVMGAPPPAYSTIPGTVPLYMSRTAGPPPSYDDVINPEAPPPSYHSLFGQVREARKSASGLWDFVRKLILLLIGTLGCTMIIGFTLVIPLSMIIIGTIYMNECRVENIPEFLFIGGIVWIFKNMMNVWAQCRRQAAATAGGPHGQNGVDEMELRYRKHESLLNCFLFGWFVAGCVVIYRAYIPDFEDRTSVRYCNRTVYMFAFWLITSTFIGFALLMTCLCGLTMSAVFANANTANADEELPVTTPADTIAAITRGDRRQVVDGHNP